MTKPFARLLGVVVFALAMTASGATAVAGRQLAYEAIGTLDYVWTGVPSRDCEADGLCGVTGSLQVTADESSDGGSGPPTVEVSDQNAVVRVEYPGTPTRICADPLPYDVTFFLARKRGVGANQVGVSRPNNEVSAGQCAGPVADDLGSVRLPVHPEPGGDYSLGGTVSFGAGPFAVTVNSTLRVLVTRQGSASFRSPNPGGPSPGPKPRHVLAEEATVSYRIASVSGAIDDTFTGLPAPLCEPLAACGTRGSIRLVVRPFNQTLDFYGTRIVKRHRPRSRILADLHAGLLSLSDDSYALYPVGTLTGSVAGPSSSRCSSTVANSTLAFVSKGNRSSDELYLDPNGAEDTYFGFDSLRTRCPGPGADTIIGDGAVAAGGVRVSKLGAPRIDLVLRNPGSFTGVGYTGKRGGSITLTLVHTHTRARTARVTAYGNQVEP